MKYLLAGLLLIGTPLGALSYEYGPSLSDIVIKTPITEHSLNGSILTYKTPLHRFDQETLTQPIQANDLKHVDVYMTKGPDDTAYAYLMTKSGKAADNKINNERSFHLTGTLSQTGNNYEINYGLERLSLPTSMLDYLEANSDSSLKAVWRIRSNGRSRFAGLEVNGELKPYRLSLKDVLFGRTQ